METLKVFHDLLILEGQKMVTYTIPGYKIENVKKGS